jgi:hypothetical protein
MATTDEPSPREQERLDSEEVMRLVAEGKKVTDPELLKRVRERSEKAQAASGHRAGSFAVQAIRELRGPLDEEQERWLTLAQRDLLRKGELRLIDPDTGAEFVVVPAAEYDRLRGR